MMKKMAAVWLAVSMALVLSGPVLAEETIKVKGTVARIDFEAKSVTIQPKSGEPVTVFVEDEDLLYKVKEGQKGQAKYVVKDGKNIGRKLRKLTEGC